MPKRGMPILNSTARGDLMVRLLVEVPTKLNTEQKRELIIKIIAAAPEKSDRHIAKSIGV